MLLAHEDVGHGTLGRDLLEGRLHIGAVICAYTVSHTTQPCAHIITRSRRPEKEKEKPKRTILIQLDSAERRPELAQEILAGFAERTPGFGEDN